MDWGSVLEFIGGTAIVVAAGAWVARSLISHFFSRDLEKHKMELNAQLEELRQEYHLEFERFRSHLEAQAASDERIRAEIVRWANPILGAVNALDRRLTNVLKWKAYVALRKDFTHPNWSVTYDYFMSSTLYLFAAYFCWVGMLRERLSFELFQSQREKDEFFSAIDAVDAVLGAYPPEKYSCAGPDVQVFSMQQRAIGEAMMKGTEDRPGCISYHEFLTRMHGSELAERTAPLRDLLDGLTPRDDCRWKRLKTTHDSVRSLQAKCRQLLNLEAAPGPNSTDRREVKP